MKYVPVIICLLGLSCSHNNPYYGLHLSDYAYNVFFDDENKKQKLEISSKNEIGSNEFYYALPDSLGGNFTSGSAVVEVELNEYDLSVKAVNLIGMKLYNKKDSTFIRYDKFYAGSKRVTNKKDDSVKKYMPFIEHAAKNLNYRRKENDSSDKSVAYCKFHFNETANVKN